MEGNKWGRIAAGDVAQFVRSPFALWCKWYAPENQRDPNSLFMKLLFDAGSFHEQAYVGEAFPEAQRIADKPRPEGFLRALQAMARGTAVLYGVPLYYLVEDLYGAADLLELDDSHPSVFGPFHYRVREVKIAKGIRPDHRIQAAFYTYILGKIQGYAPETFTMVNGEREAEEYPYDEAELLNVLQEVRRIRNGAPVGPTFGSCDWPWSGFCNREAERLRDVSLVPQVGPVIKGRLTAVGIRTIEELASTPPVRLETIRNIGEKRARSLTMAAQAIITGRPTQIGPVIFPSPSVEIFLDLEGTLPLWGRREPDSVDYLIGALLRQGDRVEYCPFLAKNFDLEGQMIRSFSRWLGTQQDFVIYHWGHYEPSHLTKLLDRHDFSESVRDRILDSLQDLYRIATRAFVFPTYRNGVKDIARFLGFQWRHADVDAKESMALYHCYVQDPDAHGEDIAKILDYNEDDCRATMVIKDWLVDRQTPSRESSTSSPRSVTQGPDAHQVKGMNAGLMLYPAD